MLLQSASTAEISTATKAAFGSSIDVKRYLDAGEAYALKTSAGVALFVRCAPAAYKITLCLVNKLSGTQTKQSIIDAFDWMFANTDAEVLQGYISSDNKACLAMVPQTWGYTLTEDGGGKMYVLTKERWNKERAL